MRTFLLGVLLCTFSATLTAQQPAAPKSRKPVIREEQSVIVNGVREVWRLEWTAEPAPFCEYGDESAWTCVCTGFAYGETGDLYLVRLGAGKEEIDRLHLTPFFTDQDAAVLPLYPTDGGDRDLVARSRSLEIYRNRPFVHIMQLADYDHDGNKTEFYLQTDAGPCGHTKGIVVGVSARNPRLHAFTTVTRPGQPLILQKHVWEALRRSSSGTARVLNWACGDHGAESQTEVVLRWSAAGIDGVRREYDCPESKTARRLLEESPL